MVTNSTLSNQNPATLTNEGQAEGELQHIRKQDGPLRRSPLLPSHPGAAPAIEDARQRDKPTLPTLRVNTVKTVM